MSLLGTIWMTLSDNRLRKIRDFTVAFRLLIISKQLETGMASALRTAVPLSTTPSPMAPLIVRFRSSDDNSADTSGVGLTVIHCVLLPLHRDTILQMTEGPCDNTVGLILLLLSSFSVTFIVRALVMEFRILRRPRCVFEGQDGTGIGMGGKTNAVSANLGSYTSFVVSTVVAIVLIE